MEFGLLGWAPPFEGARIAKESEDLGFDIRYFGENTCFWPDTFGELRDAARATKRIKLAVGVTNTVTRHPSAIAAAMAPVQMLSEGRAVCAVGKGDSAMAVIGRGPQKHAEFTDRAQSLRKYLRGESQPVEGWDSRLRWLDDFPAYTPVPVEIMCSGPRTLKAAAMIADRITLAIGAAPERLDWAFAIIDEGLAEAGRTRADITVGGWFSFAIDDNPDKATQILQGRMRPVVHMASFKGHDLSQQPEILRKRTERLRHEYDYAHHTDMNPDNPLNQMFDAEFANWFGIGGSAGQIVDRIGTLRDRGLEYVVLGPLPPGEWETFVGEVMPQSR
jgi:5,10-methylenetetrahydromethanopterin reductase